MKNKGKCKMSPRVMVRVIVISLKTVFAFLSRRIFFPHNMSGRLVFGYVA